MYSLGEIPFIEKLKHSQRILIAGVGGGFDIFSGIPLFFMLKKWNKEVVLANYSFSDIKNSNSERVYPNCYLINEYSQVRNSTTYFPEKYLVEWFFKQGEKVALYAFQKTGVKPLKRAYNHIIETHNIDTVILIDGGTDSLLFGDEEGLGTPIEDQTSLAAVFQAEIRNKYLVSLGFGIDHFHGVSHYRVLENIATLIKSNGYLGALHLTNQHKEAQLFVDAVQYLNQRMTCSKSIVSNSISSAIQGEYGNHQTNERTKGSQLWINPLMSFYWCIELDKLMDKNKLYSKIKNSLTLNDVVNGIENYRKKGSHKRKNIAIPLN